MDSLVRMMQMNRLKQRLKELDDLKIAGEKLVAEIADTAAKHFPEHLKGERTGTKLEFTFCGVKLLARVEIPLHDEESAKVATYRMTESPPGLQHLNMDLKFDWLGNVDGTLTRAQAAGDYLPELMKALQSEKIPLLP